MYFAHFIQFMFYSWVNFFMLMCFTLCSTFYCYLMFYLTSSIIGNHLYHVFHVFEICFHYCHILMGCKFSVVNQGISHNHLVWFILCLLSAFVCCSYNREHCIFCSCYVAEEGHYSALGKYTFLTLTDYDIFIFILYSTVSVNIPTVCNYLWCYLHAGNFPIARNGNVYSITTQSARTVVCVLSYTMVLVLSLVLKRNVIYSCTVCNLVERILAGWDVPTHLWFSNCHIVAIISMYL